MRIVRSMIEDEFLRIQKRPKSVLHGGFLVFLAIDRSQQVVSLRWRGLTGETADVEGLQDLLMPFAFVQESFHDVSLRDSIVDDVTVEEVKGLRQIRFHFYFAGANRFPRGSAEGSQEIGRDPSVCYLHGPGAQGKTLELVFGVCYL